MNMDTDLLNFVNKTLVVSNTPAFLYSTIRDQKAVVDFANSVSSQELIDEIKRIAENPKPSQTTIAAVYLILACLSFKCDYDLSQLTSLSFNGVEWYGNFLSFLRLFGNSSFPIKIEATYTIPESMTSIISESSSSKSIDMQGDQR